MPHGTLKKRAEAYKKITNSILLGSLENEDFKDVEIVTLSQYARDRAYLEAIKNPDNVSSYEELRINVETLLETQYQEAKEFISIEEERIVIGIDAEKADDRAVNKALLLLVELENFEIGSFHTFGDPVKLNPAP